MPEEDEANALDEEEEDEEDDGESEHPEDTRQIIGGERVEPPAA